MSDIIPLAGLLVSGVLLFPVVVGAVIRSLRRKPDPRDPNDAEIARLEAELAQTREELHRLAERQQFVEALLEKRDEPTALPP